MRIKPEANIEPRRRVDERSLSAEWTAQRSQPIATGAEPEIVGSFLEAALHDPRWRDCTVALISGGLSNLTYRVASDAGELVLRRPPLGQILPTAHDMVREYRVQSALGRTRVPVPRMFYLRVVNSELGAPYYLMERVVGHICRDQLPPGYGETEPQREAIGRGLIETLAELHLTDPAEIGLADFGRPAGFMGRQLRRWSKQWEASKVADLPVLERLRDELARTVPDHGPPAIVHGDFRLDNAILHPAIPGRIVAVLDWEMSTLGDPLADLGTTLAYWSEAGEHELFARARILPPVTAASGFPSRAELIERYAELTGFDLSDIAWYQAFAYFKLAVVCQGIAARAAAGAMLGSGLDNAQLLVEPLIRAGDHVLSGLNPRA